MTESGVDSFINKQIDTIWAQYDKEGNGVLDKEEAKEFVSQTIVGSRDRLSSFTDEDFEACFKLFDEDGSGTIEKNEMANFIKKVAGFDRVSP